MRKPVPFGQYLLLDRIAVGGMAEVFAAKTFGVDGFERTVAIKRILPNMVEDEEFVAMFKDEARIVAVLNHPGIVQVYELGRHDETYFIAMEYVSGRDVRLLVDRFRKKQQTVPFSMAAYILARMAEGLDYAHTKKDAFGTPMGIIHRDVSPQNVLVSYDGDVKLIDFGIAKATGRNQKTQAGILKGKFAYMSPEQVRGIPIDYRSDLYSAGVMLYEMITGTRLFSGESDFSTLEKVRAGTVQAPSEINAEIPEHLEKIVMKALAKDRDERYQSGAELHDDLMRFLLSGKEVYSARTLGASMKEAFAEEYRKEEDRIRRWHEASEDELEHDRAPAPHHDDGQRKKVRIGGPQAVRGAPEPEPPPREADSELEAPIDSAATQVKSIDGLGNVADGATSIIRREDIADPGGATRIGAAPTPPRERTHILDEREIQAAAKMPPRPHRRRSRVPALGAAAGVILFALGVVNLQVHKGQRGLVITIKGATNAQATIDGVPQQAGSGPFVFRASTPDHVLKVTADGFRPYEGPFSLTSAPGPLEISLMKESEAVPSTPPVAPAPKVAEAPDAGLAVADAADAGTPPPAARSAEDRQHLARVHEEEMQKAMDKLRGHGGESRTQEVRNEVRPARPEKASLRITTTDPPSAMVLLTVDGHAFGGPKNTPAVVPDIPIGKTVTMKFVKHGYEPLTLEHAMTGREDSVAATMKVSAPPPPLVVANATLQVLCVPRAKIVVDDRVVGHTNPPGLTDITVKAGHHKVCCESEAGNRSRVRDILFAAGGTGVYKARVQ